MPLEYGYVGKRHTGLSHSGAMQTAQPPAPTSVPFREAFWFWLKLGFISFGGPAGQIAIMHAELVERRRWISENRFLHALNYCMLLPGPEKFFKSWCILWRTDDQDLPNSCTHKN